MKRVTYSALALLLLTSGLMWAKGSETRLRAALTAPIEQGDISGQADFRARDGRRQFSARVEGLQPGDMFDVTVSGVIVGKITAGALGTGSLDFDSNFEPGVDNPATQFPANFPALDGGERVEIGALSGTLQAK